MYSGTLQRHWMWICYSFLTMCHCVPKHPAGWRAGKGTAHSVGGCCDYVKKLGYYLNIYLDVWPVFSPFHGGENCCQTASVFSAQWRICPRVQREAYWRVFLQHNMALLKFNSNIIYSSFDFITKCFKAKEILYWVSKKPAKIKAYKDRHWSWILPQWGQHKLFWRPRDDRRQKRGALTDILSTLLLYYVAM